MRLCLDFDGVLHDHLHPAPGKKMGPPLAGALEAVKALQRQGHVVLIHTARVRSVEQRQHVYDWLHYFGFGHITVTVEKPVADVYVDDKACRHEADWPATMVKLRMLGVTGGR